MVPLLVRHIFLETSRVVENCSVWAFFVLCIGLVVGVLLTLRDRNHTQSLNIKESSLCYYQDVLMWPILE